MKLLILLGLLVIASSQPIETPNHKLVNTKTKEIGFHYGMEGGQNVTIDQIKYIGTVIDRYFTAGSVVILNKNWVLTAARNVIKAKPNTTQVRVGSTYSEKEGIVINTELFVIHEQYQGGWENDIALIKLATPLTYSKDVSSINIGKRLPKNKAYTIVSGFGYGVEVHNVGYLKMGVVPYLSYGMCKKSYSSFPDFTPKSFCSFMKGTGPCAYDWGSPLVYDNDLIGIFSGSYQCGGTDFPPVYADVTKFRGWITKNIIQHSKTEEKMLFE